MQTSDIEMLFDYLYWVRDRVLTAAAGLEPSAFRSTASVTSRDLRGTLVHELDVELGWRARLRGETLAGGEDTELDPADYQTIEALTEHWRRDEAEMRDWLASLTAEQLAAPPPHEANQTFPLWYYLVHILTHGMQELSDAAVPLAPLGRSPRNLGFLDFADTLPLDPRR
jgi:uncharacterized damage-inducible protein DinB